MNASNDRRSLDDSRADDWTRFWFTPGPLTRVDSMRRIAAAASLFYLLTLAFDLNDLCGPHGLAPREMVGNLATNFGQETTFRWSWLMLSDSPFFVWGTWLFAVASAAGLAALWKPRWTAPATFVSILMFCHRTYVVTGPFEWALTMLLFYLCFAVSSAPRSWNAGLVIRLCQVHLTATYIAIGLSQLSGATWWEGDAVWWLMANSESRLLNLTSLGSSSIGLYSINALTHALVAVALTFPVLIWATNKQKLLLKIVLVYWFFIAVLTGWLGYAGLMLATTWFAFSESGEASSTSARPSRNHGR